MPEARAVSSHTLGATLAVSEIEGDAESGAADERAGFIAWAWAFVTPARVQPTMARSAIDSAIERFVI